MRLVAKLTLALILGMCGVLAIFGYRSVSREQALLEGWRHRGDRVVLHALSAAVAEVWRRDGSAEALRIIAEADARDDGLRLRWVWIGAPDGDAFAPATRVSLPRTPTTDLVRVEQGAGESALVYAPVDVGEPRLGAIELSESLEEEARFLHESAVAAALTVVALVALGGCMALGLGAILVGRPVQRIVEKTRRIGTGDLHGPLALGGYDELARIAGELDRMCDRLLETRDQLRHADRLSTVGKLASGIAHELGTPLNVVAGRAKRILRRNPPADTGEDARIVVEQTARMTAIIRQLLDFARRRGTQKALADVAAIARDVFRLLEPIAEKRGVALRLDETASATIRVDAGQIQQAIANLVMNGVQAMPSGGELCVAIARTRATPPAAQGGAEAEYVTIQVRDHGEGILPEHLPHVFEPFFTTKDVGEGTGLGLSVTYGIVAEHGGWIDVASEPGSGATFTVHLPPG